MARAGLDTHTLVLAAAELADAQGVQEVTLAALAAKLGVRPRRCTITLTDSRVCGRYWRFMGWNSSMMPCQRQRKAPRENRRSMR